MCSSRETDVAPHCLVCEAVATSLLTGLAHTPRNTMLIKQIHDDAAPEYACLGTIECSVFYAALEHPQARTRSTLALAQSAHLLSPVCSIFCGIYPDTKLTCMKGALTPVLMASIISLSAEGISIVLNPWYASSR